MHLHSLSRMKIVAIVLFTSMVNDSGGSATASLVILIRTQSACASAMKEKDVVIGT